MRAAAGATVLVLALAACDRALVPTDELAIRVESEAYEVRLAEGFPLLVTRSWSKELEPEEWSDETLAPLVVTLEDVWRPESATHAMERRRYRAYAAELGDVRVLPPLFVAQRRDGGGEVVVTGEALDLRVLPVLPEGDTSEVELPGGMLRPEPPWGALFGGLAVLAAAALVAARAVRSRAVPEPEPAAPDEPPVAWDVAALRALDAAEAHLADDDPRPLHDAVSGALREYVEVAYGIGDPMETTQEVIAAARADEAPWAGRLARILERSDLVRFARAPSDAADRAAHLAAARDLVRATTGGAA